MQEGEKDWICGVDEAGRGCLAGPIFAAAVVLDPATSIPGLADSKALTSRAREGLEIEIRKTALAWGLGTASAKEIDRRGIEWANRIAFTRAVRDLLRRAPQIRPEGLLVQIDGNRKALRLGVEQETVVGGDRSRPAIAAASILAKTARDRYVVEVMHASHPQYGFDRHKGYATPQHLRALAQWGPSPFHRMSFRHRRLGEVDEEVRVVSP